MSIRNNPYLSRSLTADNLPKGPIHNEPELLKRIANGDERAFKQFYESTYLGLFKFIRGFLKEDMGLAKDIVLNTYNKMWLLRARFNNLSDIRAFMYVTCRNEVYDHFRSGKNTMEFHDQFPDLSATQDNDNILSRIVEAEILQEIYQEINRLPEQRKQVLEYFFVHELTTKEIAARLQMSENQVRTIKSKALDQLRNRIIAKEMLYLLPFCLIAGS